MIYLLIFLSRVVDVSLQTIRTILVVQGRKVPAAILGFMEVTIYVVVLNSVMKDMGNVYNVLAYGLGFAAGNYVGIAIEDRLALGRVSAQVIISSKRSEELVDKLREEGFGLTVLDGHGKESKTSVLLAVLERREYPRFRRIAQEISPKAFITVNSIKQWQGGFFKK